MVSPFFMRSMSNKSRNNVVQLNRKKQSYFGVVVFGLIIAYIMVLIFTYASTKHIAGYEVKEGSLAVDNTYRGVCMRTEKVYEINANGYVNYYAREGERVAANSTVYTVDESGKLADLIKADYASGDSLTNSDLDELKTQIITYKKNYEDRNFDSVYDFKFAVQGTVMKLANKNVMESLSNISDKTVVNMIKYGAAVESGIVVYSVDGLENLTTSDISKDIFEESEHEKTQLQSNSLVSAGDTAYKLITEDNWSVCIPLDEERYKSLEEESYIKIKFIKTGDVSWGKVNCFTDANGDYYCKFDFTNSMITFATDRYLDIELQLTSKKGLKIPNSAIVKKEFYLVPEKYLVSGGGKNDTGFIREAYMEDGTVTSEFTEAQVYYSKDGMLYVDPSFFRLGEYLLTEDKSDRYNIGPKDTLIGVYNMNKGYADFTQITILYSNREYSIVKSNTDYGLAVYDHIVLDGAAVNDDDFVYE